MLKNSSEAKLFKPSTWARLFRKKDSSRINLALSIPLILDKIYKHLDHSDKKSFRAVNKTIWKHFVDKFKAESWIHIDSKLKFIKLYKSFLKVEKEGKTDPQENIKGHMFPHVIISRVYIQVLTTYSKPHEKFFWNCYAPRITHLYLKCCQFEKHEEADKIRWILSKCTNLVELRINCYFSVKTMKYWEGMDVDSFQMYLNKRVHEGKVALKLERLHLDHVDFFHVHDPLICQIAPNLKALTGDSTNIWNMLGTSLPRRSFPNLRILDLLLLYPVNYLWFIKHVEEYGANLEQLFVKSNEVALLAEVFYEALGRCVNLEKLKLHFEVPRGYIFSFDYFTGLNNLRFHNLKSFHFEIVAENEGWMDPVRFDFTSLHGMPNLERLHLSIIGDINGYALKPGLGNWVATTSPLPEPLCKNLKSFTLEGFWPVKREDLLVLNGWFPYLKYFRAPFTPESFKDVFIFWEETIQTVVAGN